MKLDGATVEKKSYCGAILTVLFFLVSLMYICTKVLTIVHKLDVDISSALEEDAISFD